MRNVTNVGAGCGGREWCCRRRRLTRTEKSRGPDAPTLASSSWEAVLRGDGGKKARSPGRARRKPLKPLRGECRAFSGVTVVTNARVYYTTRAAAGASGARHSLRPLFGGTRFMHTTRTHRAAGRRGCVSRVCLPAAAITGAGVYLNEGRCRLIVASRCYRKCKARCV